MILSLLPFILAIIGAILLICVLASGYVKAPPDIAYIISGLHKEPRILIGRAGIKIPFLERKDVLVLRQVSVDIKTSGYIPSKDYIGIDIDAIAKVQLDMTTPESRALAMKNFLNMNEEMIAASLSDSLQGNMREIVGTMDLREISSDRKKFGDNIQEKAQEDMANLGIKIVSCNIQKVIDENGLINALGQDNMSKIQKDASIAKAQADRDVQIEQAKADKEANDARVAADTAIAEKKNELALKQAELKQKEDNAKAVADAAYEIQNQEQQKSIQTATVNAQIAKAEREAELKEREVLVKKQELAATVEREADAKKYAAEKEAEAKLIQTQKEAEAVLYKQQKEAEAIEAKGRAEAAAISAKGKAEADAIAAKGLAEAEAMDKKAEAYKKYNGAAMVEMFINIMPQMAAEIAKPLASIDKVNIYGGGNNGENGVSGISGNMPLIMQQVMDTMTEATGVDMKEIIKAGTYDAKVNKNINVNGIEINAPKPAPVHNKPVSPKNTEVKPDNKK